MGKKVGAGQKWEVSLPENLPVARRIITVSPIGEAAEIAREVGSKMYEDLPADKILQKPMSPTGKEPITHYICSMKMPLEKSLEHLHYQ